MAVQMRGSSSEGKRSTEPSRLSADARGVREEMGRLPLCLRLAGSEHLVVQPGCSEIWDAFLFIGF